MKNFGVGVDIEDISRFTEANAGENYQELLSRIFSKKELKYCFSKRYPAQHLSARYSGKEAVIKAVSSIMHEPIFYNNIEILNDKNGVPRVKIAGRRSRGFQIFVSLSHCKDKSIAFAIARIHSQCRKT